MSLPPAQAHIYAPPSHGRCHHLSIVNWAYLTNSNSVVLLQASQVEERGVEVNGTSGRAIG